MSEDLAGQIWVSTLENVGCYLLNLAIGEGAQSRMQTCQSQGLLHLRIKDDQGEVAVQVSGKNLDELASQLVLASLKKVPIEKLRALHKKSLKKPVQLVKVE
jgi:hypothetical protein